MFTAGIHRRERRTTQIGNLGKTGNGAGNKKEDGRVRGFSIGKFFCLDIVLYSRYPTKEKIEGRRPAEKSQPIET